MSFAPGSIIKRPLAGFWGWFYNHMGIYVGNDTVIHFNGETKKNWSATLRKDSLADFSAGASVKLHAEPDSLAHAQAVCDKAWGLLQESANNGFDNQYSLFWRNCEDFCVYCFD